MILGSKFSTVGTAETVVDMQDMGLSVWPTVLTVMNRDNPAVGEVAVAVEINTPTSNAFTALAASPSPGAYLLPKVPGATVVIRIPKPPPPSADIKVHLFSSAASTNVGIIAE
jgi:hypothetical protein